MSEKLAWVETGTEPVLTHAGPGTKAVELKAMATPCAPPQRRHWAKESFWILIASMAQAAGPALSISILARFHGLELAGEYALAQATTTPIVQLLSLQLRPLLLTHSSEEITLGSASALRVLSSFVGLLAAGCLALVTNPIAGLVMVCRLVEGWAELSQADLQRSGNSPRMAIGSALRCCSLMGALLFWSDLSQALIGYGLFSVAVLFLVESANQRIQFSWDLPKLRTIAATGMVLGVVLCLQAVQANFPRILLEKTTDKATLGLFASLGLIMQLGNLVAVSYGQALLSEFATAGFARIVMRLGLVAVLASLFFPFQRLLSEPIGLTLSGRVDPVATSLLEQYGLVQIFVWPAGVIGCVMTAKRLYREQVLVTGGAMLVGLGAGWMLIPKFGLIGASVTQGLCAVTTIVIALWLILASTWEGRVKHS